MKILVEFTISDDCDESILNSLIIGGSWTIVDGFLDSEGYPTDRALAKIRTLDDPIPFLKEIWWRPDWGIVEDRNALSLHTGGWSGNEEIIFALAQNDFWKKLNRQRVGGHYYFSL